MDRLGFFKQGLSSLIEVAQSIVGLKHAAESFTEAVDEALSNIKTDIGLHLLSVDGDIYDQPKGTLLELARMGYSTLETGLYYGGKVHGMSAEAFKALANEAGLKITAAHLNHLYEPPVKGPDKEDTGANDGPDKGAEGVEGDESAEEAVGVDGAASAVKGEAAEDANKEVGVDDENDPNYQWWSKALDTHLKLGCQYITSSRIADYPTAEDVVTYAEYFNNIGRWTADRGMQFCYHPDAAALRKKDGEKSIFEIIAERCDQEKVCFQIDTFEALEAGVDVMELLKTYGKRIILLHLHDERNTCESGRIDFDSIIKKGIETGVKDIFIEVRSYSFPPMKCVERSLYNVQALHSIRY
jgi:sugar phosphate isomerase/epimerase